MLVMMRPIGQGLVVEVGEGETKIVFKVLGVRGNQVRVGIDAPESVKVVRSEAAPGEVWEKRRA